jgi:type II secretory pathway component PulF
MTEMTLNLADLKRTAHTFAQQDFGKKFMRWQFGARAQADFLSDLVKLLEDGVQIRAAMAFMARETTKTWLFFWTVTEVTPKSLAARSILNALETGAALADGFVGWFPLEAIEAVRSGESAGDVRGALTSIAASLEKRAGLVGLVAGELSYPAILLMQVTGILGYIGSKSVGIFQTMSDLLPKERWPELSITIESASAMVRGYWFMIPILIFGALSLFRSSLKNHIGSSREWLDKMPIFSTYRRMVTSEFLGSLALMMSNGVKLKVAINLLERNASPYLSTHLARMRMRLEQGTTNMGKVLDTGLLDDDLMRRLELLAGARNVHQTIESLGVRSGEVATKHIKASLFVTRMVMMLGVVVILGSTITAVYSLTNALS